MKTRPLSIAIAHAAVLVPCDAFVSPVTEFNGGVCWRQNGRNNKHAVSPCCNPHPWTHSNKVHEAKRQSSAVFDKKGAADADSSKVRNALPQEKQKHELLNKLLAGIRGLGNGLLFATAVTAPVAGAAWGVYKLFTDQWPQDFFRERLDDNDAIFWTAFGLSGYIGCVFSASLLYYLEKQEDRKWEEEKFAGEDGKYEWEKAREDGKYEWEKKAREREDNRRLRQLEMERLNLMAWGFLWIPGRRDAWRAINFDIKMLDPVRAKELEELYGEEETTAGSVLGWILFYFGCIFGVSRLKYL